MLGRGLDSAIVQARVRLSCSDVLLFFPHLTSTSNCRATSISHGPPGKIIFEKSSGQILPSGPLREVSPQGYATRNQPRMHVFKTPPVSALARSGEFGIFFFKKLSILGPSYTVPSVLNQKCREKNWEWRKLRSKAEVCTSGGLATRRQNVN